MVFSYFGSKSKIIKLYPAPEHDLIIEPFAGSARYALRYGILRSERHTRLGLDRDVWINDKYGVVYRIWKWIQQATISDIEQLPELDQGDDLREIKYLSSVEKELLGFCVASGRNSPGNIVTTRGIRPSRELSQTALTKIKLRKIIGKISHWKITCLDFREVRIDRPATYFIDPPYQKARCGYAVKNNRNFYSQLRLYCKSRKGQIIVCEGENADWLDFSVLATTSDVSLHRETIELIWESHNV